MKSHEFTDAQLYGPKNVMGYPEVPFRPFKRRRQITVYQPSAQPIIQAPRPLRAR